MKNKDILSKALLANSPDDAMKILREEGAFDSMQCHGYAAPKPIEEIRNNKKWWQFWKI